MERIDGLKIARLPVSPWSKEAMTSNALQGAGEPLCDTGDVVSGDNEGRV